MPFNQDFKAAPTRMISSKHIESGSGALHDFVFQGAATNSAAVKSPEILTGVAIGDLQRSYIFDTSRFDLRSEPLYFIISEELGSDGVGWNGTMMGESILTCQ